jgi:hypothetical protein
MPPKNANSASENAQKIQSEKQDDSQQQTPQEEEIEDIAAEDAQDNDQQQTQDEENANISPETPAASDSSSDAVSDLSLTFQFSN